MPDQLLVSGLTNGGWASLEFEPFKPGIAIHWVLQGEPAIAVLKYQPGAKAPLHLHEDVEMIIILDGAQTDASGTYSAGDMVANLPGSQHDVFSENGCVALLFWTKPVSFL